MGYVNTLQASRQILSQVYKVYLPSILSKKMILSIYISSSFNTELKVTYFVEGPLIQAMGWMQPAFLPDGEKEIKPHYLITQKMSSRDHGI